MISEQSITIMSDGSPLTISADSPNFRAVKERLLTANFENIEDLFSVKKSVENFVSGDLEILDDKVFYQGRELHNAAVDKLLQFIKEGLKDSTPFINFLKKLFNNTSKNSIDQLWTFMDRKNLPLTPEGNVLGYKGVKADFWSVRGNTDTVVLQGKVNEKGQIWNGVGEVIEIARHSVDDNKDHHCSTGVHIGSYDYARGWQEGKLLLVEFDPADAVSVPDHDGFRKLRVCKYKVIQDIPFDKVDVPLEAAVYDTDGDYDEDVDLYDDFLGDRNEDEEFDSAVSLNQIAISTYIQNKFDQDSNPTLKQIQSRMKCAGLICEEIYDIVVDLGYVVDWDSQEFSYDPGYSNYRVYEK
jgi:hypothetical protein